MYFLSYLTDALSVTNFFALPLTYNSAKLKVLNRFTEAPRDNFKFGGNLNCITLSLTDNLTMTIFLHYPLTLKWAW